MQKSFARNQRLIGLASLTAVFCLSGCTATRPAPTSFIDPHSTAIETVAMHACDLVRAQEPSEVEPLRVTIGALQLLLRDEQVDWAVISATFGELPPRSRRYLVLSAAMAKQYADDVSAYYEGLRRLTAGCLTGLIIGIDAVHDGNEVPGPSSPPAGSSDADVISGLE